MRGLFWCPSVWEKLAGLSGQGMHGPRLGDRWLQSGARGGGKKQGCRGGLSQPTLADTLLLPQVPTPVTEMEISVKRVGAAPPPALPPPHPSPPCTSWAACSGPAVRGAEVP